VAGHGRVGLGHSRLSIIDLTTGDQPIANEDGGLRVVVNGEFYGFEALREELERAGHHFRTRSDSEVVLHLYEETGTRCLHRLRGEFAFVLWDEPNRLLFAARDRFGIKPLFYARHEGRLYLASEVKALFAAGVPAGWDREMVHQFHACGLLPPDRTLFQGVRQVPPGHYLLADGGHDRLLPYWDFNYPRAEEYQAIDSEEHVERLRAALYEAVRIRLRADVPVGCYLSGGLDSCAVLGIASALASRPLHAFTLRFEQPEYDEGEIAQEMAEKAGAHFYPIPISSADLAEGFADAVWHAETPFINAHGVAKFLLSRAVRDAGYKVVLTGEGSDEVLAGYPHFRRDLVLYNTEGQDAEVAAQLLTKLNESNQVSRGILSTGGETVPMESVRGVLGFVPSFFEVWAQRARGFSEVLSPAFTAEHGSRDPSRLFLSHLDVEGQMSGREAVNQSLYLWSKSLLPNYILSILGDRMEMAHSLEGRLPLLDHKVVETIVQMPVTEKIRGITEKHVLREAARPVLTDQVYRRQKHPFLSPPAAARTDGPLFALVNDTLRSGYPADTGFFDPEGVSRLLDRLPAMDAGERTQLDAVLTSLTSFCLLGQCMHL
jgi:asparagine synthase (glutamine-hydrolysing)